MEYFGRILDKGFRGGQLAFLWGARKTGKSTYLKKRFPNSITFDFLKTETLFEFTKGPLLLRERLWAKDALLLKEPIIPDEIQKVPQIFAEVHWLIENKGLRFVLCGPSARKLKRGQVNLLGGRV